MKKKVLFINNHFQKSDGSVKVLIELVNNLNQDRFDITILPLFRCDRSIECQLKPGIRLKKGLSFYFRGLSKLIKIVPLKTLYKYFVREQYDIEIAFQTDLPTLLVGESLNKQAVHVAWMHGYAVWPKSYKNCDKVVCVSKYCRDRAERELNDNSINITYRYNLVDDGKIKEMSRENVEGMGYSCPSLVTVGRLSPEKGYDRLIRIMRSLKDEGYDFHLTIIGDGPERGKLEALIDEKNMRDVVTLTGNQENPHKFTSKANVFICSSHSEGYSTACTEAAIIGIPIITTDVPGGQEIIDDCECGLLTGLDDYSLKEGIRKILDDPKLLSEWREVMKMNSHKFDLSVRSAQMNELFNELYKLSEEKENKKV